MKNLIFGLALLSSATAFADNCRISSVKSSVHYADSLKPHVEKILESKGYTIVQEGILYESEDVRAFELRIREELFQPGNLVAISNGTVSKDNKTLCEKSYSGYVHCEFRFQLLAAGENLTYKEMISINESIKAKPNFFYSEKKITDNFVKGILDNVKKNVPNCEN